MHGRTRRVVAVALTAVVPVLWSLFLVLAGGESASAAPASPRSVAAAATQVATAGSGAAAVAHTQRAVRAEHGGRNEAGHEITATAPGAQPPLPPPPPVAGAVPAAYRAAVRSEPCADDRRERAPPAEPYRPRLSRGPPSPRSS